MTQRLTLEALADNLIRESRVPFNVDDFLTRIQARWRRKIAPTTLDQLKQRLWDHDNLIGIHGQKFLPCQAVLDRIGQMPLAAPLGKYELARKLWIHGYQLVPLVPGNFPEEDLVFLDPQGLEIPKVKKTFFIEEVLPYYQYSDERYFPDQIKVNQWAPGRSQVRLTVWDISTLMSRCGLKSGDGFKVHLVDYTEGVFRLAHYTASECRQDRLATGGGGQVGRGRAGPGADREQTRSRGQAQQLAKTQRLLAGGPTGAAVVAAAHAALDCPYHLGLAEVVFLGEALDQRLLVGCGRLAVRHG